MNIAEAKQQIEDTVDGYLTQDETGAYLIPPQMQRPLFLLGAPGIGKTAIVGQVASELGIGLVSYSMTHHTRQSALGLPFIVHHDYDGEQFDVSEYTMSEIIASVYDYQEKTGLRKGILFLDEINCVSETLYPSMLQFLQFKTFGRHKVPDGWIVVCAGNPPEYNRSVYDFDVVTLDRLRKISVEPDLEAWMQYALKTGVHPAIISYLEVKPDQFYSVESTPSGKSFVTARGWDDLSRVIKLFEGKGKKVDRVLVDQFLQDEDIADRFAQYYALFTKYRSDYQIADILAGRASEEICARAKAARFDERLALLRLMLDALSAQLGQTLEKEQVIAFVRDALRERKSALLDGGQARAELGAMADALLDAARRSVSLGTASDVDMRPNRLAAAKLREYVGVCEQERVHGGAEAFEKIQSVYGDDVAMLQAAVEASSASLENAFAFIEQVYSDGREMTAFVAELTARPETSKFISMFGSDAYYERNGRVLAGQMQASLLERMQKLDLDAVEDAQQAVAAAERSSAGCGCGCHCC